MGPEAEEGRPEHRQVMSEHHTTPAAPTGQLGGHAQSVLSRQLSGGHEELAFTSCMLREDQWH